MLNIVDDLRQKVVDLLRLYYPEAMISYGLTENQAKSYYLTCDAKDNGYQTGHCDILITNHNLEYSGLAIELKTPKGSGNLSDSQIAWLENKLLDNCDILVSNDYDYISLRISEYFANVRVKCPNCKKPKYFLTKESLCRHIRGFHKRKQRSSAIDI